ncbi:Hypothetical protein CM240_3072 [Clostridium bornimense]|uniref:Uncharacterized protein n=1 Tax=Clostridium bornimense TaxID=1216932 RepID=W6S2Q6_9CLOT|nr:WYL domain-containing protein [Clostridium bornimense]CDM70189.1 Hypothetical protein CM240_3072 [Clostridium bornimense]
MFSDFIKHYDNIRVILRSIFLYGCFSLERLEEKTTLSTRKISYELRRIRQYIEKDFIKTDMDGRNKLLNLSYDPITNNKNFLVSTYYNKSFTKTSLLLYFYILLVVDENKKSLNDIENNLSSYWSIDDISSKTIERKLKEMSNELDIIKMEKVGRTYFYSIKDDILKDFSNDELEKLYYTISLYKNVKMPIVAGYYVEDTLKRYIVQERKLDLDFKEVFQYKNLHFHPIIEEEILWIIIKAINEGFGIKYKSTIRRRNTDKEEILYPYKIRYDTKQGRLYVISFNSKKRCINTRMDRIKDLKVVKGEYNIINKEELYKKTMDKSWSAVPNNRDGYYEKLRFVVNVENEEKYILRKIKSELKNYKMEVIEGKYYFNLEVNDSWEMIPWFREYCGYITILEPKWLKKKIEFDWVEVLKNYGVI